MSSGVSAQAFLCSVGYVICSVFHGRNLLSLLKTIDQLSGLMNKFQMKVFQSYLILYRETVSILIDKGAQPNLMPIKVSNPKVFKVPCTKGLPTLLKLFKLSGLDTLNDVNTVSKNY